MIRIPLRTTTVDSADIRQVLIFGEGEPDLVYEPIELRVSLNPKEGHKLYLIVNVKSA